MVAQHFDLRPEQAILVAEMSEHARYPDIDESPDSTPLIQGGHGWRGAI